MPNLPLPKAHLGTKERALLKAAKKGDVKQTGDLIEKGANVNCEGTWQDHSGVTPLMYAAESGHRQVVKILLSAGADVHAKDSSPAMRGGEATALHYALQLYSDGKPDLEVIKELLTAGADPNARLANGLTALDFASSTGFEGAVGLLLKSGGDANFSIKHDGQPALGGASRSGQLSIVKVLLEAKADPNGTGSSGFTPLMAAAFCQRAGEIGFRRSNYDKIVRLLLEHGAETNAADENGQTALMRASDEAACSIDKDSYHCGLTIVQTLVEIGKAKINLKDREGKTALDFANVSDDPGLPDYLREKGAKVGELI